MHIYDTTNSTSPIALKPEKLEKLENCQYTLRLRSFCKIYPRAAEGGPRGSGVTGRANL